MKNSRIIFTILSKFTKINFEFGDDGRCYARFIGPRTGDLKNFEKNADLKSFGEFADTLHPAIFGDEVVRLFDIIIKLLLTHIHTPQMPLLTTALADELKKYTVDGYLQNLLSYHVRIN